VARRPLAPLISIFAAAVGAGTKTKKNYENNKLSGDLLCSNRFEPTVNIYNTLKDVYVADADHVKKLSTAGVETLTN